MADRDKAHVAMLFLDLDNFKIVNDTLGHAVGDNLLQAVVSRISRCMRETDTVSRQGGDEFILLLNDIPDIESVERVANAILGELAEPIEVEGRILNTSCSIGVSLYPEDGHDFDALMQKADAAMYNAKEAGRSTYRFFSEEMNLSAHEHLLLQNRLYQALNLGVNSVWCISRNWISARVGCSVSRPCCAGTARNSGMFRPAASSVWRRTVASSCRSVPGCCRRLVGRPRPGRPPDCPS